MKLIVPIIETVGQPPPLLQLLLILLPLLPLLLLTIVLIQDVIITRIIQEDIAISITIGVPIAQFQFQVDKMSVPVIKITLVAVVMQLLLIHRLTVRLVKIKTQ